MSGASLPPPFPSPPPPSPAPFLPLPGRSHPRASRCPLGRATRRSTCPPRPGQQAALLSSLLHLHLPLLDLCPFPLRSTTPLLPSPPPPAFPHPSPPLRPLPPHDPPRRPALGGGRDKSKGRRRAGPGVQSEERGGREISIERRQAYRIGFGKVCSQVSGPSLLSPTLTRSTHRGRKAHRPIRAPSPCIPSLPSPSQARS